jgi:P4 family phage/plasmid primase-like protien
MSKDTTLEYLKLLGLGPDVPLRWRAIAPRHSGGNAKVMHGSYSAMQPRLQELNDQAYGIFLQINDATGPGDKDVTSVRALFVDSDNGTLAGAPWPVAPTFRVTSGHGDHAYWVVGAGGAKVADFKVQQQALAGYMGTDPAICNLSRVMRVPGFMWTKPANRGDWRPVGLEPMGDGGHVASEVVSTLTIDPPVDWVLWCACRRIKGAPPGTSNNTLFKEVCALEPLVRSGQLDKAEARRSVTEAAEARGVEGISTTIDSALGKPRGAVGVGPGAGPGAGDGSMLFTSAHEEDIARDLIQRWGGVGRVAVVGGRLYRYGDNGVWVATDEESLRGTVAEYHQTPVKKKDGTLGWLPMGVTLRRNVTTAILQNQRISTPDVEGWMLHAPGGIAFRDGFLTAGGDFIPHSPANRALWGFDWDWEPKGWELDLPPKWAKFLGQVWGNCSRKEVIARSHFLGAWFGSALLGQATRWAKVVILCGNGANGKSVLLKALRAVLGHPFVGSVEIDKWANEYYVANLAPPLLLNVITEMRAGDWMGQSTFKSVVTGDNISARHPYGRLFSFSAVAGHIAALNELPGSSDRSEGFWRRIEVIPFDVAFRGQDAKSSFSLHEELLSEHEAFIRWALSCALMALTEGMLPEYQGGEVIKEEWRIENDPVRQWMSEATTTPDADDQEGWTSAIRLFESFTLWASRCGFPTKTMTWWGRQMKRLGVPKQKAEKNMEYFIRLN